MRADLAHVDTWIFDLDNTLYPAKADLFALIDVKMGEYIQGLLGCDPAEARIVQKRYFMEHGTTLSGLMHHHGIEPREFLDYVHDISMDRLEVDAELMTALAEEPRLMPHVHLSLQAGNDLILKRMKRRHSRADAVDIVQRLKAARPGISIGADIIAGFPTEDAAMFAGSLALVADCDIVHGHIFPYSPRAGTPAARMPQVDRAVVKDRAARLRAACAAQRERWLQGLIGTTQSVLVERSGQSGHAENFAPVRFTGAQAPSTIVAATITGLEKGVLIAQEAA